MDMYGKHGKQEFSMAITEVKNKCTYIDKY